MYTVIGNIQGLRTTYCEEVRKISENTGCGSSEISTQKWKFYSECSFLEEVVAVNRPTYSNFAPSNPNNTDKDMLENPDKDLEMISSHPKRRKSSSDNTWMETAPKALSHLATESTQEDEWDVFGKDIANSIRGLGRPEWQRRAKFAIHSLIFKISEQAHQSYTSQVQHVPSTPSLQVDLLLDHILQL